MRRCGDEGGEPPGAEEAGELTTRQALHEVLGEFLDRMPDEELREVPDLARFVDSRAAQSGR